MLLSEFLLPVNFKNDPLFFLLGAGLGDYFFYFILNESYDWDCDWDWDSFLLLISSEEKVPLVISGFLASLLLYFWNIKYYSYFW